ncbi:MAG: hypothetical protein AELANPGJ_02056 [Anaerolineae bacterium]|nr:hypothetical protein [Anaerolineae bacterium]
MKERPILFSGAMVRAILSGAKTQTRRIVKPQPTKTSGTNRGYPLPLMANDWAWPHPRSVATTISNRPNGPLGWEIHCPYGQPGDRLWVRESFNLGRPLLNCEGVADDEELWIGRLPKDDPRKQPFMRAWRVGYAADGCEGKMRPSIHMPRWASRMTLEITSVRVERLNDINEADAIAEGVTAVSSGGVTLFTTTGVNCFQTAKDAYAALWESINGPGSWDANPWVWVVEFRRIER